MKIETLTKEKIDNRLIDFINSTKDDETNFVTKKEIIENFSKAKNSKVFLIEEDNKYVSAVGITIFSIPFEEKPLGYIDFVYTVPEYRNRHYAEKLMKAVLNYAKQKNCCLAMLFSLNIADRIPAHNMYRKLGFDGDMASFFARPV